MPLAALLTLATASVLLACAQNRNAYNDLPVVPTVRAAFFHNNIQDITELAKGVVAVCQNDEVVIFSDSGEKIDSLSFGSNVLTYQVFAYDSGSHAYVSLSSRSIWRIDFTDEFKIDGAENLDVNLPSSSLLAISGNGELLFFTGMVARSQFLFDTKSGRALWKVKNEESVNVALIDEDTKSVFFGTSDSLSEGLDNYVSCLIIDSGEESWRIPSSDDVIGLFSLDDEHLIAIEKDTARVIKKSDGAVVSTVSTKTPINGGVLRGSGECRLLLLENYNDTIAFEVLEDFTISPIARVKLTERHSIVTSKRKIFMVGEFRHSLAFVDLEGYGSQVDKLP